MRLGGEGVIEIDRGRYPPKRMKRNVRALGGWRQWRQALRLFHAHRQVFVRRLPPQIRSDSLSRI